METTTPAPYTVGSFVYASWGYEQTNIDFFKVVKRSGDWLTLQPVKSKTLEYSGQSMTGRSEPTDEPDPQGKTIRRKMYRNGGEERGMSFTRSYGWIREYDGKPKGFSTYA